MYQHCNYLFFLPLKVKMYNRFSSFVSTVMSLISPILLVPFPPQKKNKAKKKTFSGLIVLFTLSTHRRIRILHQKNFGEPITMDNCSYLSFYYTFAYNAVVDGVKHRKRAVTHDLSDSDLSFIFLSKHHCSSVLVFFFVVSKLSLGSHFDCFTPRGSC